MQMEAQVSGYAKMRVELAACESECMRIRSAPPEIGGCAKAVHVSSVDNPEMANQSMFPGTD